MTKEELDAVILDWYVHNTASGAKAAWPELRVAPTVAADLEHNMAGVEWRDAWREPGVHGYIAGAFGVQPIPVVVEREWNETDRLEVVGHPVRRYRKSLSEPHDGLSKWFRIEGTIYVGSYEDFDTDVEFFCCGCHELVPAGAPWYGIAADCQKPPWNNPDPGYDVGYCVPCGEPLLISRHDVPRERRLRDFSITYGHIAKERLGADYVSRPGRKNPAAVK